MNTKRVLSYLFLAMQLLRTIVFLREPSFSVILRNGAPKNLRMAGKDSSLRSE